MKPIWIDFKQPRPLLLRALRMALLACGVLALAYALLRQQQVAAEKTALAWQKQSLTRFESRRLPILRASTDTASGLDAAKHANDVLRQLNQPWNSLFNALEHSVTTDISLLSVAPDPHKASITLKADAVNIEAAIAFVERLQATKLLTGVHLANQELTGENKRHPLQFTLNAAWGTSR